MTVEEAAPRQHANQPETSGRALFELLLSGGRGRDAAPALSFTQPGGALRTYSYAELFGAAGALADRLPPALGPGPIGILVESQEQQVLHYLAVLASGRVPSILTPPNRKLHAEYYARTLSALLRQIGLDALITDLPGTEDAAAVVLEPGTLAAGSRGHVRPERRPSLDRAAFIQFSSGTTGIKKGVHVTAAAAVAQLRAYGQAIELRDDDVIVSWLPLYHDMGFITALHLPLFFGAHAVMIQPVDWVTNPRSWFELATAYRATLAWHPNFAYQFMVDRVREAGAYDLSSIRNLVNCSEPTTHRAQSAFAGTFASTGLRPGVFTGCYAMAETTFAVTHAAATDTDGLDAAGPLDAPSVPRPVPTVGRPIAGVELTVVAADGRPAGERELGEIVVQAPFLACGYYANPDATAAAFPGASYRTGDLGYWVDGSLHVTGRQKDLLIVAGVNIHPGDVEELVSAEPGVQPGRVAAFSSFDERAQTERVTVLLEPAGARDAVDVATIRARLVTALGLANFEVHVVERGWLVKSTSGKMARLVSRDKWFARTR